MGWNGATQAQLRMPKLFAGELECGGHGMHAMLELRSRMIVRW